MRKKFVSFLIEEGSHNLFSFKNYNIKILMFEFITILNILILEFLPSGESV